MSSTITQNIDHRDLKAKYNIFFFSFNGILKGNLEMITVYKQAN